MNKVWIGTNWKMTKTIAEGISYINELKQLANELTPNIELFIIPSYTALVDLKRKQKTQELSLVPKTCTGKTLEHIQVKSLLKCWLRLVST